MYDKIYIEAELEPNDTEEQVVSELIEKCKKVAAQVSGASGNMYDEKQFNAATFDEVGQWKEEPIGKVKLIDLNFTYDQFLACIKYSQSVKELEECETGIGKGKNITDEEKRKLWLAYDEQYSKLSNQTV